MQSILRTILAGIGLAVALTMAGVPEGPINIGFVGDAAAGLLVAPVRRTAVVATVAATSTANANAAAAANANAAAAQANAAAAPKPQPGAPLAVGSIVTSLPPGCAATTLNGVAYERCGSTYYRAQMMGSNLVFVVAQP